MSRSSASLIEAHEDEYYPIPDLSAADMLRFLIDQWGISRQNPVAGDRYRPTRQSRLSSKAAAR